MKDWRKSRTLIFNTVVGALVFVEANSGALQQLLPVDVYAALLSVVIPANMLLRTITTQPLGR